MRESSRVSARLSCGLGCRLGPAAGSARLQARLQARPGCRLGCRLGPAAGSARLLRGTEAQLVIMRDESGKEAVGEYVPLAVSITTKQVEKCEESRCIRRRALLECDGERLFNGDDFILCDGAMRSRSSPPDHSL
ncbi:hypothetical protein EYF80_014261 [Liparis tanakae]|uniref:Uncharacterized protein n=1 Tax=Liparis tanakae TaxID=230148 RepID=A0A4Z2IBN5_9TELE|nr:hypothetical protein EYF80_014261 [Liparis tanakae]